MFAQQIATPKRRHSSLFQRMQQEIQKISKKLSVTKTSARLFSHDKNNFIQEKQKYRESSSARNHVKHKKQMSMINQVPYQRNQLKSNKQKCLQIYTNAKRSSILKTVRFNKERGSQSPLSGNKTIKQKPFQNRRLNFSQYKKQNLQETVQNLQKQNKELSIQIKNLQKVCQGQSYRAGYMTSYYQQKQKILQRQNSQYIKENVYLKTICKFYKSKALEKML